jgi:diaminopimelate decarboxylase
MTVGSILDSGILPDSATVTSGGHLAISGCDLVHLADQYGTPLYVYDEITVRARASAYRDALAGAYRGNTLVCYAAKAYCAPWLLRVIADEGLGLDVVSGGELHVARRAGFPMERTYFHGNNKSEEELRLALEGKVGRIVLDNLDEIRRLGPAARSSGRRQAVLLRVTPGVEAHTHEFIKTGVVDTKFGLSLETGAAEEGVRATLSEPSLDLRGLHAHIGSQIFEMAPYREAVQRVLAFAAQMRERHGFRLGELSPGGGFGMRYTPADDPLPPGEVARTLAEAVTSAALVTGFGDTLPAITIEPGRSIVGPAGVALYRVGSIKEIPGVRTYVAVDGGMADNIRPATYGAVYSALLANRASESATSTVAIAGKYCESGDVLIREAKLPPAKIGDLLAVPGSGAYNLAMASNYNLAQRPAVVVVANGEARLVRRRETYEDLLRNEVISL